eukprot:TRINITY_DN83011_c0_g1_i1.p1 TRINITY_DN83011_c0_g1~~TRINITY_DN83011_c0_g1_i1.p1  ORF type:complete len:426 (+),score=52.66 TRINITY_DN83011_c0_g1_i1:67-1278(+)
MGLEQQYASIDVGCKLQLPGYTSSAEESWPHAETVFLVAEHVFGVVFTVEVLAKFLVFRCDFFWSWWNLYDTLIMICWSIQGLNLVNSSIHPLFLRFARMGRLLRLLRFFKAFQVFDVLHLLTRSLRACMRALMWSALVIALVIMATALLMIYMLQDSFEDESIGLEERLLLYSYFGTFTRGMFSMYELTMGNWVPISRAVIDNVNPWYMLFFVAYRTLVGFAVLNVVTAVFNAETFRVNQSDDSLMLMHRERQIATHTKKMQQLLLEGDESQDGHLCLDEFRKLLENKKVKTWLLAQEIELKDVELAFRMIDTSGDGRVSPEELVRGLAGLKGTARSVDMITILHAVHGLELMFDRLNERLGVRTAEGSAVPQSVLQNTVSATFHRYGSGLSSCEEQETSSS